MRKFGIVSALMLCLSAATSAQATDVTFDFNGWVAAYGLAINGPSGYLTDGYGVNPGPTKTFTGLADGVYTVDLYQNPGGENPDFSFTVSGGGVQSVTTNNYGSGPYTMVTGFVPGTTTLVMNTHTIKYNANLGNTGSYYSPSGIPYSQTGMYTYTAIPAGQTIDNLYNSGAGNEDFSFGVDSSGNAVAAPGFGGGPTGIPNSEYATFSGNEVNIRTETVHYILNANTPLNMINDQAAFNSTGWLPVVGGYQLEFDVKMPIGGSGVNVWSFGDFMVNSSDAALPDGSPLQGVSGTNDFLFRPTLRYDGTSNGTGYYWLGPGPGFDNIVSAEVTGFFDGGNTSPISLSISAILPEFIPPPPPAPEPTTLALLGFGVAALVVRRRKRS